MRQLDMPLVWRHASGMAKLTLRIDDEDLHRRIGAAAAEDERSLNGEIIWLLRVGLDSRGGATRRTDRLGPARADDSPGR